MARPMQEGVGYFPKDTAFYQDDKVKLLRAEFGAKGMYLLDYILCELYGKDGYFMKWDRNKCYLVSDGAGCGCSPSFVDELIAGCVRCDIFDKSVFEAYGVITSAGIQRRYVRMFNGRDYIRIVKEYFLLDVNDKKDIPGGVLDKCVFFSISVKENPDKSKENPDKSKENAPNKIKEKESKKDSLSESNKPEASEVFIKMPLKDGTLYDVPKKSLSRYRELYRGIDVESELRKMCGWLEGNPTRRKTKGGMPRFINSWFARASEGAEAKEKLSKQSSNNGGSFDTDEFFEASVRKSYEYLETK